MNKNLMWFMIVVVICATILSLTSCRPEELSRQTDIVDIKVNAFSNITSFVDDGAKCYVFQDFYAGGLSCLACSDLPEGACNDRRD